MGLEHQVVVVLVLQGLVHLDFGNHATKCEGGKEKFFYVQGMYRFDTDKSCLLPISRHGIVFITSFLTQSFVIIFVGLSFCDVIRMLFLVLFHFAQK